MSYGWLSESTLAPKKAKSLNVPKGSISVLNKLITKHTSHPSSSKESTKRQRPKNPFESKNPGVELRNRVDKIAESTESQRIRDRLEEKAKLYNSLVEGRVADIPEGLEVLVDFKSKGELDKASCTVQEEPGTILKLEKELPDGHRAEALTVNVESLENISAFSDED